MEFSGFSSNVHTSDIVGVATSEILARDPEITHESAGEAARVSCRIPKPKREYKSLTLKRKGVAEAEAQTEAS